MSRYVIIRKAPLPPHEICYLTSGYDHGEMLDIWSAHIESALTFPDHESANGFLTISEMPDAELFEIEDLPKPPQTIGSTIYRFFSAILIIFGVLPLFLLLCVVNSLFDIVNNFTYYNYKSYVLPPALLEKVGTGVHSLGFLKIWMNLLSPIIMIYYNFKEGIKTIKF